GTLWGQDQQQSGDVLASGSGYSGSAKPAAEAPPDEIDTIQPETATQQPHPDQVAADLAGQQAEAADAADVEPDEAVEPSAAADQPTDGDEPIDTQQRRSGGAGRAAIAGLRNFRPWRGRGGVAADEATTTETDRIAAETGEPSAVADQPADAEERSETQEERSDLQRRRVTAGLRNIRLRRGSADVIAEEGDVPAEAEGAAEPGQPPAGPDEASNVQRRLGEAGRAAMAGLRNIRPRRGRGDLPAEDEPTAETGLPPASATEQADQAQQESGDEDLEADPAGHQPDATEDPVADVADPPARQE
ncbi:MAG: hypothetical protein J2P29_07590, partial [Actinobacteria bacterium]|nr:hypothetical protein [Actinomycetota bacterium]